MRLPTDHLTLLLQETEPAAELGEKVCESSAHLHPPGPLLILRAADVPLSAANSCCSAGGAVNGSGADMAEESQHFHESTSSP